jgi:hypothetical protein
MAVRRAFLNSPSPARREAAGWAGFSRRLVVASCQSCNRRRGVGGGLLAELELLSDEITATCLLR